jgi:hypothetical protein
MIQNSRIQDSKFKKMANRWTLAHATNKANGLEALAQGNAL